MDAPNPTSLIPQGTKIHSRVSPAWPALGLGILAAGVAYAARRNPRLAAVAGTSTAALTFLGLKRFVVPSAASSSAEYMLRLRWFGGAECTVKGEAEDVRQVQRGGTKEFGGRQVPPQFREDFHRFTLSVNGVVADRDAPAAFVSAIEALLPGDRTLFDDSVSLLSQGGAVAQTQLVTGLFVGQGYHVFRTTADNETLSGCDVAVDRGVVTYTQSIRWLIYSHRDGDLTPTGYTVDAVSRLTRGQPDCQITLFPPVKRDLDQLLAEPLQS